MAYSSQTREVQHPDGQHREEGHAADSVDEDVIWWGINGLEEASVLIDRLG
jgi:hypothetical protein